MAVAGRDDNHMGFLPRGRIDWGSRRLPAGAAQGWLMLNERSPSMRKTLFCGVDHGLTRGGGGTPRGGDPFPLDCSILSALPGISEDGIFRAISA